ncbi:unnamed protein product [Urochloa humidicola]
MFYRKPPSCSYRRGARRLRRQRLRPVPRGGTDGHRRAVEGVVSYRRNTPDPACLHLPRQNFPARLLLFPLSCRVLAPLPASGLVLAPLPASASARRCRPLPNDRRGSGGRPPSNRQPGRRAPTFGDERRRLAPVAPPRRAAPPRSPAQERELLLPGELLRLVRRRKNSSSMAATGKRRPPWPRPRAPVGELARPPSRPPRERSG